MYDMQTQQIFFILQRQVCAARSAANTNVKRPPLEGLAIVLKEESSPMILGRASVS